MSKPCTLAVDGCGDLHDYRTGDFIRRATFGELAQSIDAAICKEGESASGAFALPCGRLVYVQGECRTARIAALDAIQE